MSALPEAVVCGSGRTAHLHRHPKKYGPLHRQGRQHQASLFLNQSDYKSLARAGRIKRGIRPLLTLPCPAKLLCCSPGERELLKGILLLCDFAHVADEISAGEAYVNMTRCGGDFRYALAACVINAGY